ncbi:MFS transporter [uncultured Ferrovibrio sp.]|jgi:Cyanate permease|uniref:MFS transporter n=1 Tax=uncultured Ferrovibrio sp. TaxID=1576913 RepID=UPI00260705B7|nr:MFS transporter [uncultured Ferrovibrio sp.]
MAQQRVSEVESSYAWFRLIAAVLIGIIGGVGMWSIVVIMPVVQAEFGIDRADASLPYTMMMIGLLFGAVVMGRLADRHGIFVPLVIGASAIALGYVLSAFAGGIISFTIAYGLLIGMMGGSAMFAPLIADTSLWFTRHRGLAIGLCASGNYFSGTLWPPVIEHFVAAEGWRATHIGIGLFCIATILPLALALRRRPPVQDFAAGTSGGMQPGGGDPARPLGLPINLVQALLMIAGLSCCVAMSMPQVHIVAYCVDLGYGPARGAEMLSLMLAFGIVSRLASGWILDRIGGLATLLLGSVLQAIALAFYIPFDGLASLYIISAMFGLVQGGIVPSYAFIVRELFPASQAGLRISLAISATLGGMALGGWVSGAIFDATGSYQAAMMNGVAWNIVNAVIAAWLLTRQMRLRPAARAS